MTVEKKLLMCFSNKAIVQHAKFIRIVQSTSLTWQLIYRSVNACIVTYSIIHSYERTPLGGGMDVGRDMSM